MDDVLANITQLVRLRAHCPSPTTKFVSRRLEDGDLPNTVWEDCGHSLYCGCDFDGCDNDDAYGEAFAELEWQYGYLDILNKFLANNNQAWLEMLRNSDAVCVRVEFTFDLET
jgi:hypothetical protein